MISVHIEEIENLLNNKQYGLVLQAVERALQLPELTRADYLHLLVLRARAALARGDHVQAIQSITLIHDASPDYYEEPQIQELLADSHFGQFEAHGTIDDSYDLAIAEETYQAILRQMPGYANIAWIHYQYGRVHLYRNHIENAAQHFQTGLNLPSYDPVVKSYCYERLGYIEFFERRNLKKSLQLLGLALAVHSGHSDTVWLAKTHLLRANVANAAGRPADVVQHVRNVSALLNAERNAFQHTQRQNFLSSAGEILAQIEGYETEALALLQQYLGGYTRDQKADLTWARVNEFIADIYFRLNRCEDATAAYDSALAANPDHPWGASIHFRIAKCYYQQGDYENTIVAIKRVFASASELDGIITDYRVYDILGSAYFALGNYADAIMAFDTALENAPQKQEIIEKIALYRHYAYQLQQEDTLP